MRWVYPDTSNPNSAEAIARDGVRANIRRWWSTFARDHSQVAACFTRDGNRRFDLPRWMAQNLQAIHPEIFWEYGPALHQPEGHRLVLSPEVSHDLEPLVREVLRHAPSIPGWEFRLYRPAEDVEQVHANVEARTGGSILGASARLAVGGANLIDISLHIPHRRGDSNDVLAAAHTAVEGLVGEENYHFWTGAIDELERKEGSGWLPLDRLASAFEALKTGIRDKLSPSPVHMWPEDHPWTTFEREFQRAEDYAGFDDVYFFSLGIQEAASALPGGRVFASERFSRHGEMFGFVKLDFAEFDRRDGLEKRAAIEDELMGHFGSSHAAGICGNGTGDRYSYIMIAFRDVLPAVEVIRAVARKHKVSKRSWIQFCDARLHNEWFGIYPQSPPPPPVNPSPEE